MKRRVCCVRGPGGGRAPQSPVGKLLVSALHLSIKLWAALCAGLSLQEGSEPAVTPPSRLCCRFLSLGPVGQGPALAVQLLRTAATAPQTPAVGWMPFPYRRDFNCHRGPAPLASSDMGKDTVPLCHSISRT